MKEKLGWFLVTKGYRGGQTQFAMRMTRKIQERFGTWDELFEYIGEHTDGGHEDGYRITAKFCETKPKVKKTLRFEKVTRETLTCR